MRTVRIRYEIVVRQRTKNTVLQKRVLSNTKVRRVMDKLITTNVIWMAILMPFALIYT